MPLNSISAPSSTPLIYAVTRRLPAGPGSFIVMDKMTPYDLWSEIVEKQNMALAILAGLMALGIAIIIAAAVH